MELALDRRMPRFSSSAATAASPKTFLTPVWASSKLPLHGVDLQRCRPAWVAICRRWISLVPLVGVEHLDFNARRGRRSPPARPCRCRRRLPPECGSFRCGPAFFLASTEQLRHELQGVVLEGAGRAVPQLERIQAVADLDGLARLAAKGSAVGRCRCGVQEISAVIGQKTGQDLFGQLGIGEIFPCASKSAWGRSPARTDRSAVPDRGR